MPTFEHSQIRAKKTAGRPLGKNGSETHMSMSTTTMRRMHPELGGSSERLERDLETDAGGPGKYSVDLQKWWR